MIEQFLLLEFIFQNIIISLVINGIINSGNMHGLIGNSAIFTTLRILTDVAKSKHAAIDP